MAKKTEKIRYTADNAPRCRVCGKTAADWVIVSSEEGPRRHFSDVHVAVKLEHDSRGWICQFCKECREA